MTKLTSAEDMPDGITNTRAPHDNDGETLRPGRVYRVWPTKGQPRRMIVAEDPTTFDLIAIPCTERGQPLPDAWPQRIDQMSAAIIWESTEITWEGLGA